MPICTHECIGTHMKTDQLNKLTSAAAEISLASARDSGELGFTARSFVLATLPHSKPKEQEIERHNGDHTVTLMAKQKVGLPYGVIPRLILCWLSTEVVKTKKREIVLGDSMSEFMRKLDMVPTGGRWGSIKRFKDQTEKLFRCNVEISRRTIHEDDGLIQDQDVGFRLSESSEFWWSYKPDQKELFDSTVTLSEPFYEELVKNPLPIDLRALKALRKSPMAIDIYCWLTMRLLSVKRPTLIPWESLQQQFGAGYPNTAKGRQNFKDNFKKQLKKVLVVYPEAKVSVPDGKGGLLIKHSKPHVEMLK